MKHMVVITCSSCGSETNIILGVTSTLLCQKCGAHRGTINGDKTYKAFCPKCETWFKIKAGEEIDLRHSCGSQVINIARRSSSVEVETLIEKVSIEKKISIKEAHAKKTSIVIPVWNNLGLTQHCINSIKKFTKIPYQLVVVDNGSSLDVMSWLGQNLSDDNIIIRNSTNVGFASGCNQGIKLSTGYYILLLNNDTVIKSYSWLMELINGLDHADVVGAMCAKVSPDNNAGIFRHVGGGKESDKWSYIEGWCIFAKRQLFNKLGGFDEQFSPAYSEDADFSFRVKKMGKKILRISVPIDHVGEQSHRMLSKSNPGQSAISNRLLYMKWVNRDVKNILIKRRGAFGDVIFTTPIVRALRKKYSSSRIFYETDCPHAIQYNPYIYKLLKTSKPSAFDKICTLEYEKIPQKNCIDVMASQANIKLDSRKMDFHLTPLAAKLRVRQPYIVLHTGKVWESRQWPVDRFQKVAEYILSKNVGVVEVGNNATETISPGKETKLYSKFIDEDWNTVGHLIKNAAFFFGVDSGPSVIAKALQVPSIVIYGCVDPETRFADSKEHPLYIDFLKCSGCRNKTSDTFVKCKQDKVYCLDLITVDMVIKAVDKQLRRLR